MSDTRMKLAVLIDADNASPKIAEGLFDEIARIGEATLRRIYGDFSTGHLKGWTKILAQHAIIPHQQFAYTKEKNSSDIALVIDAMDLLHSGRFDGFCLVSSDSDFTRLAARIREEGLDVYGIGQKKTPESFRQACTRFIFTENFQGAAPAPEKAALPDDANQLIDKALAELEEAKGGWVDLGPLGKLLINLNPEFDTRSYGYGKLSDLIEATGQYEIERPEKGALRLRRKPKGRRRR